MIYQSVIAIKKPRFDGWVERGHVPILNLMGYPNFSWIHLQSSIVVISAVECVANNNDIDIGVEYHLSVTLSGQRCTSLQGRWACEQFDLDQADEDNHINGKARHYWQPVAEKFIGRECPCKEDEPAFVQDKGDFVWRPLLLK